MGIQKQQMNIKTEHAGFLCLRLGTNSAKGIFRRQLFLNIERTAVVSTDVSPLSDYII